MIPLSTIPKPTNGTAATRNSRVAWPRVSGAALWLPADAQAASLAAASVPALAASPCTAPGKGKNNNS